MSEKFTLK